MSEFTTDAINRGQLALDAYYEACKRPNFPELQRTAKPYEVLRAVSMLSHDHFQSVTGPKRTTTTAMARIASLLVAHLNHETLFAYPGQARLMELSGLGEHALDKTIKGLCEAGLIGVISGTKSVSSRYYPLFHRGSREAFEAALNKFRASLPLDDVDDSPFVFSTEPNF